MVGLRIRSRVDGQRPRDAEESHESFNKRNARERIDVARR